MLKLRGEFAIIDINVTDLKKNRLINIYFFNIK